MISDSIPKIQFVDDQQSLPLPLTLNRILNLAAITRVSPAGIAVSTNDEEVSIVAKIQPRLRRGARERWPLRSWLV